MEDAGHYTSIEPQPIADQLMVRCSCGWSSAVSVNDIPLNGDLWAEARRRAEDHEWADVLAIPDAPGVFGSNIEPTDGLDD